jgi:hypothetical protein
MLIEAQRLHWLTWSYRLLRESKECAVVSHPTWGEAKVSIGDETYEFRGKQRSKSIWWPKVVLRRSLFHAIDGEIVSAQYSDGDWLIDVESRKLRLTPNGWKEFQIFDGDTLVGLIAMSGWGKRFSIDLREELSLAVVTFIFDLAISRYRSN